MKYSWCPSLQSCQPRATVLATTAELVSRVGDIGAIAALLLSAIRMITVLSRPNYRGQPVRLLCGLIAVINLSLSLAPLAAASLLPRSVVIIESANPGLPFDSAMASAMRSTLGVAPSGHI
jgi:hypothetical protein